MRGPHVDDRSEPARLANAEAFALERSAAKATRISESRSVPAQ
jgi:hypothetical protein